MQPKACYNINQLSHNNKVAIYPKLCYHTHLQIIASKMRNLKYVITHISQHNI